MVLRRILTIAAYVSLFGTAFRLLQWLSGGPAAAVPTAEVPAEGGAGQTVLDSDKYLHPRGGLGENVHGPDGAYLPEEDRNLPAEDLPAVPAVCSMYLSHQGRRLPDIASLDHADIAAVADAIRVFTGDIKQLGERLGAEAASLLSVQQLVQQACRSSSTDPGEGYKVAMEQLGHDLATIQKHLFHWIPESTSMLSLLHSYKGRGIVMTFGNGQIAYAISSIRLIVEEHRSDLPIEIYYYGTSDLSAKNREILQSLADRSVIKVIDLKPLVGQAKMSGWALKPLALAMSSFKEAILIDADTTFFKDPAVMFVQKGYSRTGALLMRDRAVGKPKPERTSWLQTFLPTAPASFLKDHPIMHYAHATDSSCVVMDKQRHFSALLAITQLNMKVERGVVYKKVFGDKETFWMGFEIVNDRDYAFEPIVPSQTGSFFSVDDIKTMGNDEIAKWPRLDPQVVLQYPTSKLHKSIRLCSSNFVHFTDDAETLYSNGGPVFSKFQKEKWFDVRTHIAVPPVNNFFIKSGNRVCVEADEYRELSSQELQVTRNAFLFYKEAMEALGTGHKVITRDFPQA